MELIAINYLTQNVLEDESQRLFIKKISGANINQEDWKEASESEKTNWEKQYVVNEI